MSEEERYQLRRAPRQARGQQRVAQILDAAEQLFASAGYAASSTNQIAAHAGVPIGSLYQFFPNKAALLHAVAARYSADFHEFFGAIAPSGGLAPSAATLVDAMVTFGTARKGFTRIILAPAGDPDVLTAAAALQGELALWLDRLIARERPGLAAERRALITQAGLTATLALLASAVDISLRDEARATALIGEARALLSSYLDHATAATTEEGAH